jgi:spore maturation protein CgeB
MREQIVAGLAEQSIDIRIFGPWRRKLAGNSALRARLEHGFFTPQRMAEIFAACNATLNIHTWRGRFDYGLNPRVFEAAACGVPQLVDHKRELDELFDPAERAAMLVYRSDEELLEKARLVSATGEELRQKAVTASASIRERHSYLARMRELLRICGK